MKAAYTELLFFNARFYDPQIGRFISADTIVPQAGNPQDFNRYAYTRNNPTRFTDPTGHCVGPLLAVCLIAASSLPLIGTALIVSALPGDSRPYEGDPTPAVVGASLLAPPALAQLGSILYGCLSQTFCDPSMAIMPSTKPSVSTAIDDTDEVAAFLKQYEDPGFRGNMTGASQGEVEAMARNAGYQLQPASKPGFDPKWASPDGLQEVRPHWTASTNPNIPPTSNARMGPTIRIGAQIPQNLRAKMNSVFGSGTWTDGFGFAYFDDEGILSDVFSNNGHIPLQGNGNLPR